MKKQKEKISVTCPKCGEKIDIQDILENRKFRDNFEKTLSADKNWINDLVIKKEWFETEIIKIQSKIEKLSESDSEEDKNTISKLQAQKCNMEQIKQKIIELMHGIEKQIKSFETEISSKKFTCPKCGGKIDDIEDLLKKEIVFYHEQTGLLSKIKILKCQLNEAEDFLVKSYDEKARLEKEIHQIKMMIEVLSESNSEEDKNMVSQLKERLIDIVKMIDNKISEIEKSQEKLMSLEENIKSLQGEIK
ncbi:MAG: hypothetical protein K6C94_09260 [Candidatus Gastranaerophilales bacterium]|nr:hypothetical protein [Candidatus Gastranaerophilales bacterium]